MSVSNCFTNLITLETKLSKVSSEIAQDTMEGLARLTRDHLSRQGKTIDDILGKEGEAAQLIDGAWKELSDVVSRPIEVLKKGLGLPNRLTEKDPRPLTPEETKKLEDALEGRFVGFRDNYHILNQKDAIKLNFNTFLQRLGLRAKLEKDDALTSFLDREGEGAQRNSILGEVRAVEVDPRTLGKASVKFNLGTLRDETYDASGNIVPVKTSLGLDRLVPLNKVQAVLLNTLSGISNIDDMFKKLDKEFLDGSGKYKKGYLWIQQLKDQYKIGLRVSSDSDARNKIAFEVSSANTNLEITKTIFDKGYSKIMSPVSHSNNEDVRLKWQNNAKESVDTTKGKSLFTVGERGTIDINRASKDYKDFIDTKGVKTTEQVLEKLGLLGITFEKDAKELEPYLDQLSSAYYALVDQLKNNSNITKYSDLFGGREVNGRILNLAKVFNDLNVETKAGSFQGAEGQLSHSTVKPSTASIIIDGLKQVATLQEFRTKFPHLNEENKFIQRSQLLKPGGLLFDKNSNKRKDILYTLITGVGEAESSLGKSTESLGMMDRISQELNYILTNTDYIGINGDKSREMGWQLPEPLITYKRAIERDLSGRENPTRKILDDYLQDEMDAAFQEKINPSYIKDYHEGVFKFGYFREILGPELIDSFNKRVVENSKNLDDYFVKKAEWLNKNYSKLTSKFEDYIDKVSNEYVEFLEKEGVIEKIKTNEYLVSTLNPRILTEITGKTFPESSAGIKLHTQDLKNLSRFLNLNYEFARVEQSKLFYGHPALYTDAPKRLAMLHAPKGHFSQNQEVLFHYELTKPRLDGRDRVADRNIQFSTYKETLAVQEGYDKIVEFLYSRLSPLQKNKKELQRILGAEFDNEGKFVKLITDKDGKFTGQVADWINIKEGDSQVWALPDHYWEFRVMSGNMNAEDFNVWDYDRAFEINDRSRRNTNDPAYKSYSKQLMDEAKTTLERYKNDKEFRKSVDSTPRGVYKPQYFGYSDMKGLTHTVIIKMAVKPLSWKDVANSAMQDAYIKHQERGDDMFGFPSAEKVGVVTDSKGELPDFYNEFGEYSNSLPPLQNLDPRYLGVQTEVPTEKRKVIGSQVLKLILSNTDPKHYNEAREYISTLSDMYDHAGKVVMRELGLTEKDGEYYTQDVRYFVDEMRNKANGWGVTDNQIDSIVSVKMKDGSYQLQTKFDALPSRERFENILWGIISRKLVNREMYGIPSVQISDLGIEPKGTKKIGYYDTSTQKFVPVTAESKLTPEQRKKLITLSPYDSIPHIVNGEIKSAKVNLVWHDTKVSPKEMGLVKSKEDGLWRDENGVLPQEFFEAIGFRIPTSSMGSIMPSEVAAFFDPSEGDISSRPAGQIARDGSDFDVDKFNIALQGVYKYNGRYFWNGDYKTPEDIEKRAIQVYEDNFSRNYNAERLLFDKIAEDKDDISRREEFIDKFKSQYLQNKLLKHMKNLLLTEENYVNLMTPISMGPIPDIAKEVNDIKGYSPDEANPTKLHQLKFSQENRAINLNQKKLVGMTALSGTLHAMSQEHVANIKLTGFYNKTKLWYLQNGQKKMVIPNKRPETIKRLKETPIDIPFSYNKDANGVPLVGQKYDVDGNLISANIDNSMQASVDGAKNPVLAYLNIGKNNMAQYQYLIGKGVSPTNSALLFFPQPALVELDKELNINNSLSARVNEKSKYRFELIWKVASKFYDKGHTYQEYLRHSENARKASESLNNWDIKRTLGERDVISLKKEIKEHRDEAKKVINKMLTDINSYRSKWNKNNPITRNEFLRGLRYQQEGWTKPDDAMFQASMVFFSEELRQQSSQEFALNRYLNLDTQKPTTFASDSVRRSNLTKLKDANWVVDPENIFKNTQLEALQRNLDRINPMAENYFIGASPRMKTIMEPMIGKLESEDASFQRDEQIELLNKFQNFTIARILLTTPTENGEMMLGSYKKMLFGTKSSARILSRLKKKFPESVALKALSFEISEDKKKPDSMRLFKYNTNIYELNQITDSLVNLYTKLPEDDLEGREWIKSLGIYSIIQSGLQNTRSSIQKALPTEIYTDIVGKVLTTFQNRVMTPEELKKFTDLNYKQFHQLNVRDNTIVPKVLKSSIHDENILRNGELIALGDTDYNAPHDFIKVAFPDRGLTKEQIELNNTNDEGWKNYKFQLYEKINKNASIYDSRVWYKRINILGEQSKFNEVYPEDFHSSLIEENGKFNELDPNYKNLVDMRTRDIEEIDVPLSMETKQPQLFIESDIKPKNHSMKYPMKPEENLTGKSTSTIELIEQGLRTATTRSYPLGKVGDIITFEGRPSQYIITEVEQLTKDKVQDPGWIEKWSEKEQWTVEHFQKVLGGKTVHEGSWQTTFEKIEDKQISTPETLDLNAKLEELHNREASDTAPFEGGRRKTLEEFKSVGTELYNTLKAFNVPDAEIFERIKSCI